MAVLNHASFKASTNKKSTKHVRLNNNNNNINSSIKGKPLQL